MIEVFGTQIGTIAQVVTMIFGGGIFGVMVTSYVKNKEVTKNAEHHLRTHFGNELSRLAQQVRDCEADKTMMRREINAMHDEISGLKRQISNYSADRMIVMEGRHCPSDIAPEAAASARRVKDITENKG